MTDDVTQIPQQSRDGGRPPPDDEENGNPQAAGTPTPPAHALNSSNTPDTPNARKHPASFGDIAKTIRSRTTDLLAIAVLLIGGVAVGSRVSGWWNADEAGMSNPEQMAESTAGRFPSGFTGLEPFRLDFGNSRWSLRRSIFAGSRTEASAELLSRCRNVADDIGPPQMPLQAAERKLLARLADAEPVETTPEGYRIYRADGPVMMASVTGPVTSRNAGRQKRTAKRRRRVLCWGLMFPAAEYRWVCYLFVPTGRHRNDHSPVAAIPLPPGARLMLAIRSAGGDLTQTYHTDQSPASVRMFYAEWSRRNGWNPVRASSNRNTFVFQKTTDNGRFRVEVNVARNSDGQLTCSVFVHRVRGD